MGIFLHKSIKNVLCITIVGDCPLMLKLYKLCVFDSVNVKGVIGGVKNLQHHLMLEDAEPYA